MSEKVILDACCGSRMFWFDKNNPLAIFADNREISTTLCDGRSLEVKPDVISDFKSMLFDDGQFKLVVFDPPHLVNVGEKSWLAQKYGRLSETWKDDLKAGFRECFRVLENYGVLIFKWNETQIPVSQILELVECKPLFGHKSGKRSDTHWIVFMKVENEY